MFRIKYDGDGLPRFGALWLVSSDCVTLELSSDCVYAANGC